MDIIGALEKRVLEKIYYGSSKAIEHNEPVKPEKILDDKIGNYAADERFLKDMENPVNLNGEALNAREKIHYLRCEQHNLKARYSKGIRTTSYFLYGASLVFGGFLAAYLKQTPAEARETGYMIFMTTVTAVTFGVATGAIIDSYRARRHHDMIEEGLKEHGSTIIQISAAAKESKKNRN